MPTATPTPTPTATPNQVRRTAFERQYTSMPEEFMRGGGCFAPEAEVLCVKADGAERRTPVSRVVAGARIRTLGGGVATVRCVVESACDISPVYLPYISPISP